MSDGTISQYGCFQSIPKCVMQGLFGKVWHASQRRARKQSRRQTKQSGDVAKVAEVPNEPQVQ